MLGDMAGRTDRQTLGVPRSTPPPSPLALLLPLSSHRAPVGLMATAGTHIQAMWPWRDQPGCEGCLKKALRTCCPSPKPVSPAPHHPWLYSPGRIAQAGSPRFLSPG